MNQIKLPEQPNIDWNDPQVQALLALIEAQETEQSEPETTGAIVRSGNFDIEPYAEPIPVKVLNRAIDNGLISSFLMPVVLIIGMGGLAFILTNKPSEVDQANANLSQSLETMRVMAERPPTIEYNCGAINLICNFPSNAPQTPSSVPEATPIESLPTRDPLSATRQNQEVSRYLEIFQGMNDEAFFNYARSVTCTSDQDPLCLAVQQEITRRQNLPIAGVNNG